MNEKKYFVINARADERIKERLRLLAQHDRRSISQELQYLIDWAYDEIMTRTGDIGVKPERRKPMGNIEIVLLAKKIKSSQEWNADDLKKLCEYAGLSHEWEQADGENFETVAQRAADILGVDIV
jgi:hypothetical protein